MQRYIYLILSSSSSLPAKIIKWATQNELNHSSISLDDSLNCMYSFGRLKINQPFNAGFVVENKDAGFYKKFTDTKIRLYRLAVDEKTFNKTKDYLMQCVYGDKYLKYNFLGAILSEIKIGVPRVNQYFCSEFVASLIKECDIRELKKPASICHPYDFLEFDNMELLYKGLLSDYNKNTPIANVG